MSSIYKWFIIAGVLLFLYPLFGQAETISTGYKPKKSSYSEDLSDRHLEPGSDTLKTLKPIALIETDGTPLRKMPEKEALPKSQISILRSENAELNEEVKNLSRQLKSSKYSFDVLNKSFENLKDISAKYSELETKYNETTSMLSKQNKKVDKLEEDITSLLRQQNIRWFFSGVAVFLLGFIIGYNARREKRRSFL